MSDQKKEVSKRGSSPEGVRARLEEAESELAEHRRLEETLHKSEQRFRTIFEHSNDGIFLVDVEQDAILDVNAKASRMLGYSRRELLALPMSLIHPHEMAKVRAFAQSVVENGQGFTDELTCLTKSGEILDAEISASIFEMEDRVCMIASVRDVTERSRLALEREYLLGEIRTGLRFGPIIGDSPEIKKVLEQIEQVAPTDSSVLISGESGTGKELVARAIHEHSRRRQRTLVRVNCASIPAELFESEFFGHVKGAFTSALNDRTGRFELAHGGTIFLDEVGEIPPQLQSKMLRVLQEGEFERVGESRTRKVDVRIIAATNRELLAESKEGRFRQDLYYRLSVFPLQVPPLREHPQDVAPLAEHCLEELRKRLGKPDLHLKQEQIELLECYPWPGNVRELQNVIERSAILAREGELVLDLGSLPAATTGSVNLRPAAELTSDLTLKDLDLLEREVILRALERSHWKIYGEDGAAALLSIKPTTLAYRMKKMGIRKP